VKVAEGVVAAAAGTRHTLFVTTDYSLYALGRNDYGQFGTGDTNLDAVTSPHLVMGEVCSVAAGGDYSLIIKNDGNLWACGANTYGQLGDGSMTNQATPVRVGDGVKSIVTTDTFSAWLGQDGVIRWAGEYGIRTTRFYPVDAPVPMLSVVTAGSAIIGIGSDGILYTILGYGQFSPPRMEMRPFFEGAIAVSTASSSSGGGTLGLILRSDGRLFSWGYGLYGALGPEPYPVSLIPIPSGLLPQEP
jgi:alpha-tubulin suppressor-like RCC1 family protein